jgi:hypothetical protein
MTQYTPKFASYGTAPTVFVGSYNAETSETPGFISLGESFGRETFAVTFPALTVKGGTSLDPRGDGRLRLPATLLSTGYSGADWAIPIPAIQLTTTFNIIRSWSWGVTLPAWTLEATGATATLAYGDADLSSVVAAGYGGGYSAMSLIALTGAGTGTSYTAANVCLTRARIPAPTLQGAAGSWSYTGAGSLTLPYVIPGVSVFGALALPACRRL